MEALEISTAPQKYDARRLGWRHAHAALVCMVVCVCYGDRTNIGIVMARQDFPGIPHNHKGTILSAFFVGYFMAQIPGSIIARRFGAKPTLMCAAFLWTMCDVLTPVLANLGFIPLLLGRVGMGIGQGFMFPVQFMLSNFWVPTQERAFLCTAMSSGQEMGSIFANVVSPKLLRVSLSCVFLTWGVIAFVWGILFNRFGASAPELHPASVKTGEASWIRQHREAPHIDEVREARQDDLVCPGWLLRKPCVWSIFAAHTGVNYVWYTVLSWLPTFFAEVHDLDLSANSHILAIPYFAGWSGILVAGRVSDFFITRGVRTRSVRKRVQLLGAFSVAIFLQLATAAKNVWWAGIWMTTALFFGRMQQAAFWVNMLDVCPETAGILMGMSNTIATIPGIIGQPITQYILDTSGSWAVVYGIGGLVGIVASLIFAAFADDIPLDERRKFTDEEVPLQEDDGDTDSESPCATVLGRTSNLSNGI